MKFDKAIYINYDPFSGDRDVDIRCKIARIVKTRKEHPCMLATLIGNDFHSIPIGGLAKYESAMVDGEWGSYYVCLDCMDKWLAEDVGLVIDDQTGY